MNIDALSRKLNEELESFRQKELQKKPEEVYDDWDIISFKETFVEATSNYLFAFLPIEILTALSDMDTPLQTLYEAWSAEDFPCALSYDDLFDWLITLYRQDDESESESSEFEEN